jgi:hypothetical protein
MPQVFTGMPFVIEGRFDDPDNFPNPFLNYTWSVLSCPTGIPSPSGGAQTVFLDTVSVTPRILVDTPGDYVVQLAVFDGVATTKVLYSFTAAAAYAATAYLSGSCASTGSGLSSLVQLVYANATSVLSQNDANAKAAANAANALNAVLTCCPASIQVGVPNDAPPGSVYSIALAPYNQLPKEDFSPSGFFAAVTVGTGVNPGGSLEIASSSSLIDILAQNKATNLVVQIQEPSPISGLNEPANFDLTLTLLANNGNLAGTTIAKRQKNAAYLAPSLTRSLLYEVSIPSPAASRLAFNVANRMPPLPVWQINGAGWDTTSLWTGKTVNALGLFLLTGGTITAPTSEALVLAMNVSNSDISLMSSYYDIPGFSQLPYQGSLYGYSDRRALAPVPRTGFIGSTPSTVYTWAQALADYVKAYSLNPPYNFYFRTGSLSGASYTWFADSFPLHLERAGSSVTRNSLTPAAPILSATNSVITFTNTDPVNSAFFATVRGVPSLFVDLYRWSSLAPANAVAVGVYSVTPWPSPITASRLLGITPGTPGGRGYDTSNLALNSAVNTLLKAGGTSAFAFYYENAGATPLGGFPLLANNLTSYAGAGYSLASMPSGTSLPVATNNVLVNTASGTKVYLVSNNA